MTVLANRITSIEASPTLAIDSKAKAMRAQGVDIINLSVGEPDFDTPDFIKEAAYAAIADGESKYTAADGTPALKAAIIEKLARDNQLHYEPEQIVACSGLKQGLYNACQVLINPGDEVIIPAPYWVSYPAMVKLAGGTAIIIKSDAKQGYKITADQLRAAITDKTKLFFLNSPSNPTGQCYSRAELQALAQVLIEHPHIYIISDDIYEYITWGNEAFCNIVNVCPELGARTIVGNGMSKSFAMTGWRIGYTAGPKAISQAMKKLQSQSTGCPNAIAQRASAHALTSGKAFFEPIRQMFKNRHDQMHHALNQLPGVQALASEGTFYLFADISDAIEQLGLADDVAFADFLLDHAKIAAVPGTAFGAPGHIRISCANSDENLARAVKQWALACCTSSK